MLESAPEKSKDIEVTLEMVEAGVEIYREWEASEDYDPGSFVSRILLLTLKGS